MNVTFPHPNAFSTIDGLIVLGYGNSPNGVKKGTTTNANYAVELLKLGIGNYVIATGLGPYGDVPYPTTEADAIKDTIVGSGLQVAVYTEGQSISTFDNMGNTQQVLTKEGIDPNLKHYGIVGEPLHALRAEKIAQYVMPLTIFTAIPVDHGKSVRNTLRLQLQYQLTLKALAGLDRNDPESFVVARKRYEQYIRPLRFMGKIAGAHRGR